MYKILIRNIRIPNWEKCVTIGIDGDKICAIEEQIEGNDDTLVIDGANLIGLPGFIDVHIHGANMADFMDGEVQAVKQIAHYLPKEGTTSFLATTLTQSSDSIMRAIEAAKTYIQSNDADQGAQILGFHLEGPFINEQLAGAQPQQYICKPSISKLEQWFGGQLSRLKIITLAPEMDTNNDVIRHVVSKGVIASAGHTNATYANIREAMNAGLTHLTHYSNAMSGLHHREVGVVGAAILEKELYCEVIADGIHLADEMLQLIYKTIGPERILLITDSIRAKGMGDGEYQLGGQLVHVVGHEARLEDGTLAGSVLRMNDALKTMRRVTGATLEELAQMSSTNAAQRLGIAHLKGSIEAGMDADIVLLDENWQVKYTIIAGEIVFEGI